MGSTFPEAFAGSSTSSPIRVAFVRRKKAASTLKVLWSIRNWNLASGRVIVVVTEFEVSKSPFCPAINNFLNFCSLPTKFGPGTWNVQKLFWMLEQSKKIKKLRRKILKNGFPIIQVDNKTVETPWFFPTGPLRLSLPAKWISTSPVATTLSTVWGERKSPLQGWEGVGRWFVDWIWRGSFVESWK